MSSEICPTRLERVVVGADACEFCEGATREAINLAQLCHSKLYAVAVVEVNQEFEALAPKLVEDKEREVRGFLESFRLRASKAGVECELIARQGEEAYEYIVEEAKKQKADMIVMGRRGRKGLKRLIMGSVTAQVIGHAPCNVLVVPRLASIEFKNIIAATDGSANSEAAVAEAAGIAKRRGGALTLVSVEDPEAGSPGENLKKASAIVEKEGVKAEALTLKGKPYEAVVNLAKEKGADLVVVGIRGRTKLEKILMGSVTERIIALSPCAVLAVKA